MIKLLFVVGNLNIGGPQKSLIALFDTIDYSKFEITLISFDTKGVLLDYINDNVNVLHIDEIYTAFTLPANNVLHYLRVLIKNFKILPTIQYMIAALKVMVGSDMNPIRQRFWKKNSQHLPFVAGKYDAAFGVSSGLTTYFIVDCVNSTKKFHWVRGDYSRSKIDKTIDEHYFTQLDGSLSVSKECAIIFEAMFPFMSGKVELFENPLPIKLNNVVSDYTGELNDTSKLKLLTVSRIDPFKGLNLALESCKLLVDRKIDFKWFVLGDGKYRKQFEKKIKDMGLQDNFEIIGFKLNTFEYISRCDILVHPSESEGKSNAIKEALYFYKPIVVTDYMSVREQVTDGVNGYIATMNPEDLAEKIIYASERLETIRTNIHPSTVVDYEGNSSEFFERLVCESR